MNCSFQLKDGNVLHFTVNGTTLVSDTKVDEGLLTQENLSRVEVTPEGKMPLKFENLVFLHQLPYENRWYLSFYEKSEEEKKEDRLKTLEQENKELKQMLLKLSQAEAV